jgi:adenylate cyclase
MSGWRREPICGSFYAAQSECHLLVIFSRCAMIRLATSMEGESGVRNTDWQNHHPGEVRLLLEEICCELCRYRHVTEDGLDQEQVGTIREVRLGAPGAFADIKVTPGNKPSYFVEIKWGYTRDEFIDRLARKYTINPDSSCEKLIIVTDATGDCNWSETNEILRRRLCSSLEIEIWGEAEILRQLERYFGLQVEAFRPGNYRAIRDAITRAEWAHAFGEAADVRLATMLLWRFSSWKLRQLHNELGLSPDDILRPDIYRNLVILMADLCSFSSYVRDTRDDALVRQVITTFYSQTRQAVLETGGMIDNFVGDEVIGIFGFPEPTPSYADDAIRCAYRLLDIGNSVSEHWQRNLDRVQKSGGVHIGIAMGDLNLMPLRAFSSLYVGFIGDSINMTSRLMTVAGPSDVVISNSLYQVLKPSSQVGFEEIASVRGKNIGLIRCWRRRGSKQ